MPLEINFALDSADLRRLRILSRASRGMAAAALTFTAQKAVPVWVAANSAFHKRRSWIDQGIRYRPASAANLNAQVGTIDRYMGRHVKGISQAKVASRALSLTMTGGRITDVEGGLTEQIYDGIDDAKTHTAFARSRERMGGTQRKPFFMRLRNGKVALVRRKGKARAPIEVLAVFQNDTKPIKARIDPQSFVYGVTRVEFGPIYERLLLKWAEKT